VGRRRTRRRRTRRGVVERAILLTAVPASICSPASLLRRPRPSPMQQLHGGRLQQLRPWMVATQICLSSSLHVPW
jgi:hypothetical protein